MKKLQVSETNFNEAEDADKHHHYYTETERRKNPQ